ncbi:transcriptional regulator, TetR family [Afipia sp. GAS231]|nr:transcriptional regulator, TetR family [Afipia sp. GAS231]
MRRTGSTRSYDNAFRREQAERTREQILEAMIDQLGQGRQDFSAADVAAAAGVSQRTVYQYFPDREAQINAVIAALDERLAHEVAGPRSLDEISPFAEQLIRLGASHVREMRAQIAGGLASEVRARRRRSRDRAVALAVGAGCDDPKAARLASAAINVLTSAEISLGMIDRFGIEGDDLIGTHTWIIRTLVEAIKRGDLPAPAENIHS